GSVHRHRCGRGRRGTMGGQHAASQLHGVLWQLVAIAVLARAFIAGRRAISTKRFAGDRASGAFIAENARFRRDEVSSSDECEERSTSIASHDEQGRTPVERMFKSE